MALIAYNGQDVFTDQPEPLVSKTIAFVNQGDNRVLIEETISLMGELVGCDQAALDTARDSAVAVFSDSFKNLVITGIGTFKQVKVNSINFDASPYLGSLPYTIVLTHYPDGGFEFGLGVSNPVSTYTYTENTDQTVSIQHTVSAKGINTQLNSPGNALENAVKFVEAQLGDPPRPALLAATNDFETYVVNFNETIDKLNNTVSVERSFESDPLDTEYSGRVILRYTSERNETEGEEVTVSYNGTINAGRGQGEDSAAVVADQIAKMKDVYERYEKFKDGEAGVGKEFFINETVTEDATICQLSFSFSYIEGDEDPSGIMDDFTITVEENSDSSLFAVSINGNLTARHRGVGGKAGDQTTFELLSDRYDETSSHANLCEAIYDDFYVDTYGGCQGKPQGINFNDIEISKSVGYNEYDRSVSYSASYNDRAKIDDNHTFDYTMNFTPSLWAVKSIASAYKDGWIIEDLDYRSRGIFSININSRPTGLGEGDDAVRSRLLNFSKGKFNKFVTAKEDEVIEAEEFVLNNQEVASSTFRASFYGEEEFTDQINYTGIQGFYL